MLSRLLLCLSVALFVSVSTSNVPERRCWGDVFSQPSLAYALQSSKCELCQARPTYSTVPHNNSSRIAIIFSPWLHVSREGMIHPLITLAANWINRGHSLDLHYLHDRSCQNDTPNEMITKIANRIMNSLPCDVVMGSQKPLLGKSIDMHGLGLCADGVDVRSLVEDRSPFAHLDTVEPIRKALQEISGEASRYDLVVVDAANAAGVFWAERLKIPIIMLASPNHLDIITQENHPWEGFLDAVHRRSRQLLLGWQFSLMNQIRKNIGLQPFRMPSDYFNIAVEVLLYPPITSALLPAHVRPIQPHAPQCVFCDKSFPHRTNITVAIMPMDLTLMEARAILRGINLARMYFQQQTTVACETPGSPECQAFHRRAHLRAVMLVEGWPVSYVPELIPTFVSVESGHILDVIARHPETCVVISHCDQFSVMAAVAGMTMICIPKKNKPLDAYSKGGLPAVARGHDVGRAVVRAVMESNRDLWQNRTMDLSNTVNVLETLAMIRKEKRPSSTAQLRRLLREWLPITIYSEAPQSDVMSWKWILTYLSVALLTLATGYARLFFYHVSDPSQIPAFHRKHPMGAGLFADIDPVLMHFRQWLRDDSALHNVFFRQSPSEKRESQSNPELVRKRKAFKKR